MNNLGLAVVWCIAQVTALSLIAIAAYALAGRVVPRVRGLVALTSLVCLVPISALVLSPWPRWPLPSLPQFQLVQPHSPPVEVLHQSATSAVRAPDVDERVLVENPRVVEAASFDGPVAEPIAVSPQAAATAMESLPSDPSVDPSISIDEVPPAVDVVEMPVVEGRLDGTRPENSAEDGRQFDRREEIVVPMEHNSATAVLPAPVAASAVRWEWWGVAVLAVFATSLLVGLARLVVGLAFVGVQRWQAEPIESPELLELVDLLSSEIGVARLVDVRESSRISTPATIGWRRPMILLPSDWPTWSSDERRAVLAHEIAHIRNGDFIAWLWAQFGLSLHFYHPLVHWLIGRLRLEQELAADALAAPFAGGTSSYLNALAAMALRQSGRPLNWPARAFLPTRDTLLRRIEMLRRPQFLADSLFARPVRYAAVVMMLLAGMAVAGLRSDGDAVVGSPEPAATQKNAAGTETPSTAETVAETPMETASPVPQVEVIESTPDAPPFPTTPAPVTAQPEIRKSPPGDTLFEAKSDEDRDYIRKSQENLEKIAAALRKYRAVHGTFPASVVTTAGKQPHSWRVALLPFFEGKEGLELYEEYNFEEAWDGPTNRKLLTKMPDVYQSALGGLFQTEQTNDAHAGVQTTMAAAYYMLTGPMFPSVGTTSGEGIDPRFQRWYYSSNESLKSTSNRERRSERTAAAPLLIVEAKRSTPWTKPSDVLFDPEGPIEQLNGFHPTAMPVLNGKGHIIVLDRGQGAEKIIRALRAIGAIPEVRVGGIDHAGDKAISVQVLKSGKVLAVTDESFARDVENQSLPVVVQFSAEWSGPCQQMSEVLRQLAKEYQGKVEFRYVDVDKSRALIQKFDVKSLPTLMLFKQGKKLAQIVGMRSKDQLIRELSALYEPFAPRAVDTHGSLDAPFVRPAPKSADPASSLNEPHADQLAAPKPQFGGFKGRVVYPGKAPALPPLVQAGDTNVRDGAVLATEDIPNEQLLVDAKQGMANVFVYLAQRPEGTPPVPTPQPVSFGFAYGRFVPHAMIAPAGYPVHFTNSAPIVANVHTFPSVNKPFNSVVSPKALDGVRYVYDRPEPWPIEVKSDFHPWVKAYHLPLNHPYGAVTRSDGTFEIDNIPAGRHVFHFWHESKPDKHIDLEFEIQPGRTVTIEFTFNEDALVPNSSKREAGIAKTEEVPTDPLGFAAARSIDSSETSPESSIKGRIVFVGEAPRLPPVLQDGPGALAGVEIPDERLVLGANMGIANAFVYLERAPEGNYPAAENSTLFTAQLGKFVPHAMLLRTGIPFSYRNTSPIVTNIHTFPLNNPAVNQVFPPDGSPQRSNRLIYEQPEPVPVRVTSDLHPWMSAYHLPLDHPFAAVSGRDGSFEIKNLPVGKHVFQVWHEAFGKKQIVAEIRQGVSTPSLTIPLNEHELKLNHAAETTLSGVGISSDAGVRGTVQIEQPSQAPLWKPNDVAAADAPADKTAKRATPPQRTGVDAQRTKSLNNLKQLALAMHNYHDVHKHFPPAVVLGPDGKTPHSWRVELLPFLEAAHLYEQYKRDEPWDSPNNKKVLAQMPDVFRAPGDAQDSTNTSYFLPTGSQTLFPLKKPQTMADLQKSQSESDVEKRATRFADVRLDGLSNTIAIIETKRDVPWTRPQDIDCDPKIPLPKFGRLYDDRFHIALADGSTRSLKSSIDEKTMRQLLSPAGGEPVDLSQVEIRTAPNRIAGALAVPRQETPVPATPGMTIRTQPGARILTVPRESVDAARSRNNLKQLGLALHNYHDVYNRFPPALGLGPDGKTPHSWRVAILPFIGEKDLFNKYRFDEPWDGPNNKKLLAEMPQVYRAPNAKPDSTNTVYFAIASQYWETLVPKNDDAKPAAGTGATVFDGVNGRAIREITDGTSNTIMLVEAQRHGQIPIDVPWTKPDDIVYDPAQPLPTLGPPNGLHQGTGFFAVMGDGSVHLISRELPEATLRALFTRAGGELIPPNWGMPIPTVAPQVPNQPVPLPEPRVIVSQPPRPAPTMFERIFGRRPAATAASASDSHQNLRRILLAMHNYHDVHEHYPAASALGPDGKTPHSWRVAIIPYLEDRDAFEEVYNKYKFDEPWDGPNNKKLLDKMPAVFRSPAGDAKSTDTLYFAITGKGTVFDRTEGTKISEIPDGSSNTIAVVESAKVVDDKTVAVPWLKPEDIEYDAGKPLPRFGVKPDANEFWAAFCDGSVRTLPSSTVEATLRAMLTRAGKEIVEPPK